MFFSHICLYKRIVVEIYKEQMINFLWPVIFGTLCENSADDKFMICFLLSLEKSLIVYSNCLLREDTLSFKYQGPFSGKNKKNCFKLPSANFFTQHAKGNRNSDFALLVCYNKTLKSIILDRFESTQIV